jgi:hypothetical protein
VRPLGSLRPRLWLPRRLTPFLCPCPTGTCTQ